MFNLIKKNRVVLLLITVPVFALLLTVFIKKAASHEKPKSLEQCWSLLELRLPPEEIQKFKSKQLNELEPYQHSFGVYIKKHWVVKGDPELLTFFKSAGIQSEDQITAIIIDTFWRYLQNKPVDVEERIQHYIELENIGH